jgi:hypothetical protein
MITVTETPTKKNENRPFASGVYHLNGPSENMVRSFWDYLVAQGEIEGYTIEKKED